MHQWTSLLSNCVNEQELLNGGEPLCKQRKAFYISLLCKQGLWFFIISNTISLASKHRQNRLARLVTADYTRHLTERAKFTCKRRRRALKALQDYPEAKILQFQVLNVVLKHAQLHANSFV